MKKIKRMNIKEITEWFAENHEGSFIDTRQVERVLLKNGYTKKLAGSIADKALMIKSY